MKILKRIAKNNGICYNSREEELIWVKDNFFVEFET